MTSSEDDEDGALGEFHPTGAAPETRTEAEYGPRGPPPSRRYRIVENVASVVLTLLTLFVGAAAVLVAAAGDRVVGTVSIVVMIAVVVLFMTYQEKGAARIADLLVDDDRE